MAVPRNPTRRRRTPLSSGIKGIALCIALLMLLLFGLYYFQSDVIDITAATSLLSIKWDETTTTTNDRKKGEHTHTYIAPDIFSLTQEHYNDDAQDRQLFPVQNLRLVFVGDSVTRYQYLSLAYFLAYGKWNLDASLQEISIERDWKTFFNHTTSVLAPFEVCDCHRNTGRMVRRQYYENRYFADARHGNFITFFNKLGHLPVGGHANASTIFHDILSRQQEPSSPIKIKTHNMISNQFVPYRWKAGNWSDLITNQIGPLRPDYVVMNQGLWKHDLLHDGALREIIDTSRSILTAESGNTHGATTRLIYKTTTDNGGFVNRAHDATVCAAVEHCLDLSWTDNSTVAPKWDGTHFLASVNNRMNQQLLQFIVDLETKKQGAA